MHAKDLLQYSKNLNLLLAEDHDELRQNTANILQNFFNTVDAVSNGEDALVLYENKKYDIVLTDIRMPKIDGICLVESIYQQNPEQKVIVLSAHDDSKYLIPLLNLGIEHYIKKPLDYQELINVFYNVTKKIIAVHQSDVPNTLVQLDEDTFFDKEKKVLTIKQNVVYLTKYEIIFLDILSDHVSKIYPNEEIVEHYLALSESIDAQNIRKLVSKLRKKLPTANIIESIYGVGYRMIPQI
jgi:DNA-binding response OmpR family regulator